MAWRRGVHAGALFAFGGAGTGRFLRVGAVGGQACFGDRALFGGRLVWFGLIRDVAGVLRNFVVLIDRVVVHVWVSSVC